MKWNGRCIAGSIVTSGTGSTAPAPLPHRSSAVSIRKLMDAPLKIFYTTFGIESPNNTCNSTINI